MATRTASHGISGTTEGNTDTVAETGSAIAGAGTPNSGLVVLRDELGILSVMRCLDAELTLDRGFQYGYPAESAAMAGLADPRIAPPLSYVVDAAGQIVAIVCRHITGVRLSRVLAGLPRGLDVQTATSVVKDVLAALGTLHQRGVAHRAPDPEHIIIEPNGACVLIDVGLVARHTKPDPATDIAADLELVAELFVTCLAPGRLREERRSRAGYFVDGELEGVAAQMYNALVEPESIVRLELEPPGNFGSPASAEAEATVALDPTAPGAVQPTRTRTAALLTHALEAAAADCFDAGWDGRGRERLASAARDHQSVRRRFLEFRPSRGTDHRWTLRGWHAATDRNREHRNRERLVASAGVMRQASAQLADLWTRGDATGRGGRNHAAGGRGSSVAKFLIPLIAFLLAFGVALLILGFTTPTPASTTTNAAPPTQAAASATKITSLYIANLGYDNQHPNNAVATININTSGTAPLTVAVTFDGTIQGLTQNASGKVTGKTDHFTLSGQTKYVVTDTANVLQYCSFNTQIVTAEVNVSASVKSAPTPVSTASGNLFSRQCS